MNQKQRANLTLLALAISAFAIGSTEFISVGLMPLMIKDFGITMSQAGLTVSMYALGITIGAPILVDWSQYLRQILRDIQNRVYLPQLK